LSNKQKFSQSGYENIICQRVLAPDKIPEQGLQSYDAVHDFTDQASATCRGSILNESASTMVIRWGFSSGKSPT
jgi:hypothetical protein